MLRGFIGLFDYVFVEVVLRISVLIVLTVVCSCALLCLPDLRGGI